MSLARDLREFESKLRLEERIVNEDEGYPLNEAQFSSISEWEAWNGVEWSMFVILCYVKRRFF